MAERRRAPGDIPDDALPGLDSASGVVSERFLWSERLFGLLGADVDRSLLRGLPWRTTWM
jgi:hypothetical protein